MKLHLVNHPDAERSLLGAVFLKNEILDDIPLSPEDFYDPRHREVFAAMRRLKAKMQRVDPVTLEAELGDIVAGIGGLGFFADLVQIVPTAANWSTYADIVAQDAKTRRIALTLGSLLVSELRGDDLLAHSLELISAIPTRTEDPGRPMSDQVIAWWKQYEAQMEARDRGEHWGIPTGLPSVDALLGGLAPGVVTVIGGRPSMGKSSFARTIADNVSAAGLGVHVFSLEDSATSYVYRCLSDHSNVELQRIRAMQVTRPEVVSMVRAAQDISRQNWVLDDSAALTATEIGIRVRRHKPRANTKVVIVDYVQLMRSRSARVRNKGDEVAEAAEGLAEIARKENVAVVVLSQLSRQCEGRDDKRPMLSDLRETGVIEQIADTVLFVMRPEQYLDPDSEIGR